MAVEKPYASGQWTKARYWSFIRSNLRRARWPVIYQVKKEAQLPNDGRFDKRTKFMYKCEHCKEIFKGNQVQVDHIVPCGSLKSYDDLAGFVERLFCEREGFRLLCKGCHQNVTNEERKSNEKNTR